MIYRLKGIHSPASTASGELYFSILRTRIYFQLRIFSTKLRLLILLVFAGSEVGMFRLTELSGVVNCGKLRLFSLISQPEICLLTSYSQSV